MLIKYRPAVRRIEKRERGMKDLRRFGGCADMVHISSKWCLQFDSTNDYIFGEQTGF